MHSSKTCFTIQVETEDNGKLEAARYQTHDSSLGSPVLSYGHWTTSSHLYILLVSHFPLISSHNIKPCKMEAIATCFVNDLFHNEFGRLVIEPKEFNVDSCRQHTVKAAKLMRNVNST